MKDRKILSWFLVGLVVVFFGYQIYSGIYKPVKTQAAEYCETVDGIKANGVIVRNESYITRAGAGVLHFRLAEGERLPKNGVIADVYDSAATSQTVNRIEELTRKLENIEQLQAYNSVSASDLSLANAKVSETLGDTVLSARGGDLSNCAAASEKLLTALSRRQMITGEETDFSAQSESIKNELSNLKSSLPAASATVTAPISGYFISVTDGFENVLSGKTPPELTPAFLKEIKEEALPEGTVGKIVSDCEWYVACTLTLSESVRFKEGDSVTLVTAAKKAGEIKAEVKAVNVSADDDSAVVVFSLENINRELASMRKGAFTVVSKTYRGLKIPKKALRVVNGQTGVYVLSGASLKFVPVKVIYTMEDYILCEQKKTEETALRLYDEVVTKGKKLYDGKVIG